MSYLSTAETPVTELGMKSRGPVFRINDEIIPISKEETVGTCRMAREPILIASAMKKELRSTAALILQEQCQDDFMQAPHLL